MEIKKVLNRVKQRSVTWALIFWGAMGVTTPGLAALPKVEPPTSGSKGGFLGDLTGYFNDGIVLLGLVVTASAFVVVAGAALKTFQEVRDEKAGWGKFAGILVVGVILLVLVIWLITKSASVIF
ncbi:TIGR03745 family integrating conjugative element membrane protein [Xenorhabdus griffiniae]|nr:TIGR03745 family integrating conjugative element membrane protein [Xenorhabdus griffiniae]MBE8585882.1 TIGR03745 family integrating conjugative element membrane protein [Xenorhabdus griffiniae]